MSNKIKIAYGHDQSQYGVLRLPENKGKSPVVVSIHGGFWKAKYNLEENTPLAEDLTNRGYATWNIEYRRIGEEGGGWPGTFNDIIDAVNCLKEIEETDQLDLTNVIVIGHSAGGHLALWLASRVKKQLDITFNELQVPIRKVISLAGITDLKKVWEIHDREGVLSPVLELMGGSPHEEPGRYKIASPIESLPLNVEQVLIHGELDRHVPIELSKDYYLTAKEHHDFVKFVSLADAEHFKVIDPSTEEWAKVLDTLP
ncbi:alpha/beta hydrolase family protein [Alkalibacillus haloalkaliphilus]|uniref:alpha/beta hydrolase family protein n=1 Tax=Alkalibacillus haloalkaliphilus TaxID=94136 RepID=UPI00030D5156|nr:alpha/beta hydrolase [Alkalibacillus haloalkaliphilus]